MASTVRRIGAPVRSYDGDDIPTGVDHDLITVGPWRLTRAQARQHIRNVLDATGASEDYDKEHGHGE